MSVIFISLGGNVTKMHIITINNLDKAVHIFQKSSVRTVTSIKRIKMKYFLKLSKKVKYFEFQFLSEIYVATYFAFGDIYKNIFLIYIYVFFILRKV